MRFRNRPLVLAFALGIPAFAFPAEFSVTDLGQANGDSYAYGISSEGWIAGSKFAPIGFGYQDATLWTPGPTSLGASANGNGSQARALNNSGTTVGVSNLNQAFSYSGGQITNLGTLGGSFSKAYGINSSGAIVGSSTPVGNSNNKPFLYANGHMSDLLASTPDAFFGEAMGINDAGQVVGFRKTNFSDRATIWQNGQTIDLGESVQSGTNLLGSSLSYAMAINNAGQVVGYTGNSVSGQAFRFQGSSVIALGSLGGSVTHAYGINDAGWTVGTGSTANGADHAFLYRSGIEDLNSLIDPSNGWILSEARGINASGQIVGCGYRAGIAYQHAFLLTPVPEPSSSLALLLGVAFLISSKKVKSRPMTR